ncbi:MAG: GMP reductase [Candidatus Asgardarchaeia archaeon]
MEKQLSYSDISLIPKKCIVSSRGHIDTSVQLGKHIFNMPIYPANMKSVVDMKTCQFFAKHNWFYTMHRFDVNYGFFITTMKQHEYLTSVSVGISWGSKNQLEGLLKDNQIPDYITIDVANAWSDEARQMTTFIKDNFPETFLIIGNVATGDAVKEIEGWGVDAIKCGIAGGSVCITKNKTGVHRPMVSTILDCVRAREKVIIIADGGVVEHGDIAKALACGADMVMAGSLFAGYEQSAGNIIEIEDNMYKEYYGSASKYNKQEYNNIEGKKILIKFRGNMERLMGELKEDLQSAISYIGGNKIEDLKSSAYYLL